MRSRVSSMVMMHPALRPSDGGEMTEQSGHLIAGPPPASCPEEDDRWTDRLSQGEKRSEVGIGGDQDPLFGCRPGEDRFVVCSGQSQIAYMNGVVPCAAQVF